MHSIIKLFTVKEFLSTIILKKDQIAQKESTYLNILSYTEKANINVHSIWLLVFESRQNIKSIFDRQKKNTHCNNLM